MKRSGTDAVRVLRHVTGVVCKPLKAQEVKLEVRPSPVSGNGLFAAQRIPSDTVILACRTELKTHDAKMEDVGGGHLGTTINDLAWTGDTDKYLNYAHVVASTNLKVVWLLSPTEQVLVDADGMATYYFMTTRQIEDGEELSKYYGEEYWQMFHGAKFN